jgi:hypothetical protein
MAQDAFSEVWIKSAQRLEHVRATLRMRHDGSTFTRREAALLIDDVVQRPVDLSYVVKQRDSLDAAFCFLVDVGCIGQNQGVPCNPANVLARFRIVCVNRIE